MWSHASPACAFTGCQDVLEQCYEHENVYTEDRVLGKGFWGKGCGLEVGWLQL